MWDRASSTKKEARINYKAGCLLKQLFSTDFSRSARPRHRSHRVRSVALLHELIFGSTRRLSVFLES